MSLHQTPLMLSALLVLLAVARLPSPVGAQNSPCPTSPAYTGNCVSGYDCGPTQGTINCACPHATPSTNLADCFNPNTNVNPSNPTYYGCPAGQSAAGTGGSNLRGYPTAAQANAALSGAVGSCKTAATRGDPLVQGFDGCAWYMKGQPGQILNLVSESKHAVNTQLVAANLTDADHPDGGTFHGALSFRYRDSVAVASVTPEGELKVTLGGMDVPYEKIRDKSGMRVKVSQYLPYYGQAAEITTPAFKFFVHAVQPYDTPAGHSRGHLDLEATIVDSRMQLHGLLGQSFSHVATSCSDDWNFHGEGVEDDYLLEDINAIDFAYGLYGREVVRTRRLQGSDSDVALDSLALKAVSRGMY